MKLHTIKKGHAHRKSQVKQITSKINSENLSLKIDNYHKSRSSKIGQSSSANQDLRGFMSPGSPRSRVTAADADVQKKAYLHVAKAGQKHKELSSGQKNFLVQGQSQRSQQPSQNSSATAQNANRSVESLRQSQRQSPMDVKGDSQIKFDI